MFEEGLNSDVHPRLQPKDSYRGARNLIYDEGTLVAESGTLLRATLPAGYGVAGSTLLPDGRAVLFLTDGSDSEIGVFDGSAYASLFSDSLQVDKLAFGSHVEAHAQRDRRGHSLVYFADGANPPRLIDLDALPSLPFSPISLSLTPSLISLPAFSLVRVNDAGGALASGSYQLALAYVGADGTRTNYFYVSPPISVGSGAALPYKPLLYDGAPEDTETSKSITFSLTGVDTAYERLRVAVIHWKNGADFEVRLLPDIPLSGSSLTHTYTGFEGAVPGSLDELVVDRSSFESASTLAESDGVLYLGNLSGRQDIGYQKYANGIRTTLVEELLPDAKNAGGYRDPVVSFDRRSFKRDEIYAFYISFVFQDGGESLAYHIPGRASEVVPAKGSGIIRVSGGVPATALGAKGSFEVSGTATSSGSLGFQIGAMTASVSISTGDHASYVAFKIAQQIVSSIAGWHPDLTDQAEGVVYGISDTPGTGDNATSFSLTTGTFGLAITPNDASGGRDATDPIGAVSFGFAGNKTISLTGANELAGGDTESDVATKIAAAIDADADLAASVIDIVIDRTAMKEVFILTALNTDAFNGSIRFTPDASGVFDASTLDIEPIVGGSAVMETDAVDPSDPNYDEIAPLSGKNFHFRSTAGANGMGYWENENETYAGANAEIWELDGSGDGVYSGSTLAGNKVRHHRFPEFRYSKAYEASGEARIIGVRFSNILIPNEIRKRVCAYKVYYAKRGMSSRTVLDQAFSLFAVDTSGKVTFQNRKESDTPSPATTADLLALHPFHLLRTKDSLTDCAFLKAVYEHEEPAAGSDELYLLRKVRSLAYVPNDATSIPLPDFDDAVDYTADNDRQEEKLLVRLSTAFGLKKNYTWDLHAFRSDLYVPFSTQQLVFTGYLHRDLDNPDSGSIFGGDTYISRYGYGARQVSPKETTPPTQDTYTDPLTGEKSYEWNVDQRGYEGMIESADNIFMRHEGPEPWQSYAPRSASFRLPDDRDQGYEDAPEEERFNNYLGYNDAYSVLPTVKAAIPASSLTSDTDFPTRIARSRKASLSPGENHLRIFLPDDYYDLPTYRGPLKRLVRLGTTLIPHMERGLFRTRGREEIVTGDFRAFLGSGDIFSVAPEELVPTPSGYGGLQDAGASLVTEGGYFFADLQAKKLFMLRDSLVDLGEIGVSKALPALLTGTIRLGYDPLWKRLLVTTDADTLSFDLERSRWTSYHDYKPTAYIPSLATLFSASGNHVYEHHAGSPGGFYGSVFDLMLEMSLAAEERYHLHTLRLETLLTNGGTEAEGTFTSFRVLNEHQDTGTITLTAFDPASASGNLRRLSREWLIGGFRHDANPGGTPPLPAWAYKERLEDLYHRVVLKRSSADTRTLRIYRVEPNKPVKRP